VPETKLEFDFVKLRFKERWKHEALELELVQSWTNTPEEFSADAEKFCRSLGRGEGHGHDPGS
jgi:hypothetical protein